VSNFCITCEFHQGVRRHYHTFFAALEVFADRCHALEAVWFIRTDWSQSRSTLTCGGTLTSNTPLALTRCLSGSAGRAGFVRMCGNGSRGNWDRRRECLG